MTALHVSVVVRLWGWIQFDFRVTFLSTPSASEGSPALRKANNLAKAWAKRRRELAEHLEYSMRSEKRSRIV